MAMIACLSALCWTCTVLSDQTIDYVATLVLTGRNRAAVVGPHHDDLGELEVHVFALMEINRRKHVKTNSAHITTVDIFFFFSFRFKRRAHKQ